MEFPSCVAICLLALAFLLPSHAAATSATGTIQRETKQQILAAIPPHWEENPVLFLTSPSGKYAAYFLRSQTTPGAGGLGADFCYVEVLDTSVPGAEGRSVWESECLAVSTVNTCALVFSWKGLEVQDGSNSVWHTHDTQSDSKNYLETLELVDEGDMRILDKGGELAWKASDEPRAAQHCGMPGSPGLAFPVGSYSTILHGKLAMDSYE
uniref:non-specific serine/threonine protein kinase n=1 Tax=Oryza brachyantha TaxID=4533 RepID=J3LLX7_ORYBR